MTAYTTTATGAASATGGSNAPGFPSYTIIEGTFDFTKRNLAQNDTIDIAVIPKGTVIHALQWEVLTVEGAARNFSVGNEDSATAYLTTTSANSATSGVAVGLTLTEGTPNTAAAWYNTAEKKLRIAAVTSGGLTTAKIRVKALCTICGVA
jgi:hypothetical protein